MLQLFGYFRSNVSIQFPYLLCFHNYNQGKPLARYWHSFKEWWGEGIESSSWESQVLRRPALRAFIPQTQNSSLPTQSRRNRTFCKHEAQKQKGSRHQHSKTVFYLAMLNKKPYKTEAGSTKLVKTTNILWKCTILYKDCHRGWNGVVPS